MNRRLAGFVVVLLALVPAMAACSDSTSSERVDSTSSTDGSTTSSVGGTGSGGGGGGTTGGGSGAGATGTTAGGGNTPPAPVDLQFVVPALIGQTTQQAEQLVRERGLVLRTTSLANPAPRGTVFAQDPLPATRLARDGVVDVQVSSGQVIAQIPSVVGLCQFEAVERIRSAGFAVSTTFTRNSTRIVNRVESQNPGGGIFDQQGSTVELLVSLNTSGQGAPC